MLPYIVKSQKIKERSLKVYEIYADGTEPYPGLSNLQARAKIVVQNYRMEMPKVSLPTNRFHLTVAFISNNSEVSFPYLFNSFQNSPYKIQG